MLQVKLEPQEIEFVINAIHITQIRGKDAHLVSNILKKFESKLANLKPVQG
jgi:hypothetical protein